MFRGDVHIGGFFILYHSNSAKKNPELVRIYNSIRSPRQARGPLTN